MVLGTRAGLSKHELLLLLLSPLPGLNPSIYDGERPLRERGWLRTPGERFLMTRL